ncbi:MAG: hypothetical protein J6M22_00535 [Firmicutes bacterium]|nr:hypothetical protein [Bacillota bacterium]
MGFGFKAEGPTVTTYFSDGLESKTGGFTFYNLSEEPVDVYINACDGSEKIVIEDLKEGPCWQRVEKNKEYAIGFRTDAPVGTEIELTIIDGDQVKFEPSGAGEAIANPAVPMRIEPHLAAAVGGNGPLVDEALIYTGNVTCVQNGIRVTAKQAVADNHNMYILLQVNTKKNIEFTFEDRFETVTFGVRNAWTGSDMCWNSVSKDGSMMHIVLGMDSEEIMESGTVDISLKNLINCNGEGAVYHGSWDLGFDFKVADVTESFKTDAVIHHNGVDLKIRQLDVSPFSVYIECGLAAESAKPDEDWDLHEMEIDFVTGSGETAGCSFEGGGSSYEDDWKNFICYRHGKMQNVIDPDDIKAVVINGQMIKMK